MLAKPANASDVIANCWESKTIVMNLLSRLIFRSSRSQFLWCGFIVALVIRIVIVISFGNAEHPQMYEHGDIANNLYQILLRVH